MPNSRRAFILEQREYLCAYPNLFGTKGFVVVVVVVREYLCIFLCAVYYQVTLNNIWGCRQITDFENAISCVLFCISLILPLSPLFV